jgi:transcriptional antiterminator Rof (Rho-off)
MTDTHEPGNGYRPIACASYDVYESAITRRQRLQLVWNEGGMDHTQSVLPTDLETRAGEEFLIARDAHGQPLRIRLDKIRKAIPL